MKYLITKSASTICPEVVDASMAGRKIPEKEIGQYFTGRQLDFLLDAEGVLKLLEHDEWLDKFRNWNRACYLILQLKDGEDGHLRRFEPYSWLQENGLEPDPEMYEAVYAGPFSYLQYTDKEVSRLLESIYAAFDSYAERPDDYYGRSVSVSDIIVIKVNNTLTAHYVDRIGFQKLDGFCMKGLR